VQPEHTVFATLEDVLLDVRIEDQDHSARVLREGVVLGAVTTERHPVPGCRVQPLQVKRYVPVAAPAYVERYLSDGFSAHRAATAPCVAWNRDDAHPDMLIRKAFRRAIARPVHYVPTAEGYGAAVRAALGWGMYPEQLAAPALSVGSFVRLSDVHLDVPLYWQCWRLNSPMVQTVTEAVWSSAANLRRYRKRLQ